MKVKTELNEDAERSNFEKWARSIGADDSRLEWESAWDGEGYYKCSEMDYAWSGWLARAAGEWS